MWFSESFSSMETAGVMFILLTETEADLQDLSLYRLPSSN